MEFQYEPGRFYKLDDQQRLIAEVTFQRADGKAVYILDHTFVDPSLRGQGVAKQLVDAVVDKARAEQMQIMPLCTYAHKLFDQKPEYANVYYHNPEGENY